MTGTPTPYDRDFYAAIDADSVAAAQAVLPRVLDLVRPLSVVDVGCGSGAWARVCRESGIDDVWGVDGDHVPAEWRTAASRFVAHDLRTPFTLDRRFDLALCLELGEHLPADRAEGLARDLTTAAPVVLFSAAVPEQGGTDHVNEQWPEYWVARFETCGWSCWDAIRPWIRGDDSVAWWYRQNLFLAVDPVFEPWVRPFPRLSGTRPREPVDYVGGPYDRPENARRAPPNPESP